MARPKGIPHTQEFKLQQSLRSRGNKNYFYGKRFIGKENPFYGKTHSKESKEKMSTSHKGKTGALSPSWKGGLPKCSVCNKQLTNYIGKTCRKHIPFTEERRLKHIKNIQKQFIGKQPTSIEKTLYDYLLMKGILFERQKLINGKFIVDAYIPSMNLVIEADGKYWHDLDKITKKDRAENAYLNKCGYKMIRLSEDEIKSGKFKERLVV